MKLSRQKKARIFIASSSEGEVAARAVFSDLDKDYICQIWGDSFRVSQSFHDSLDQAMHSHDFGVFVFSTDDLLSSRETLQFAPRDNVVYELGLFSGTLGRDRCFIACPDNPQVKLPSDLQGIKFGTYRNEQLAMSPASSVIVLGGEIRQAISATKIDNRLSKREKLLKLMFEHDSCDWIDDDDRRIKRKNEIYQALCAIFDHAAPNKYSLLGLSKRGSLVALAAAIGKNPASEDVSLICQLEADSVSIAHLQNAMFDAIKALRRVVATDNGSRERLVRWLESLNIIDENTKRRREVLYTQLSYS